MTNPKMPEPTGEYAKVPPGWPPQTWGAHLARIEYMTAMGSHYSFTGAERNVRIFRQRIKEECAKIIEQYAAELHDDGGENVGRNILLMAAHKVRESIGTNSKDKE